eukprot:TRINITY_DN19762_c0_g1_i1.p1 TRINITY_DN19762_c0_g1~~TRINITY_DN19762_c0_g1_i1.p1  ORF type:complete len:258 (-),score=38.51 TRINITY_DN19762_c0_g1_i1:210-983(-)
MAVRPLEEITTRYTMDMDLLLAADCGDEELVKYFLDHEHCSPNQVFNNPKFNYKCTALHYASRSGHLNVVKVLLDHGAKINAVEAENWTPLYYAVNCGHKEIVQFLLDSGADQTICDNFKGRSPLDVAKYRQFHDIVAILSGGTIDPQSYVRRDAQIEKRGKKEVQAGIHWDDSKLFLGRYKLEPDAVKAIQNFRKSSSSDDVTVCAFDTILGISVNIRHTHDFDRHRQQIQACTVRMLRASTISTNEHIMMTVTEQ